MASKQNSQEAPDHPGIHVTKRDGSLEPVNLNKIVKAVTRAAAGIPDVDPVRVATKTIGGLHNGVTTSELDQLSIQTAVSLIPENENYSKLAAALLAEVIRKEVAGQGIESFSQSVARAADRGLTPNGFLTRVQTATRKR